MPARAGSTALPPALRASPAPQRHPLAMRRLSREAVLTLAAAATVFACILGVGPFAGADAPPAFRSATLAR